MSEIIIGQVRFLLMTSLLGMALMGAYDVCRFMRWLIPHHGIVVALEDILFWVAASVPAYGMFYIYNDGEIRWYGALAVISGGALYEWGISRPLRRLGDRYLGRPKKKFIGFIGRCRRKCTEGVKRGGKKVYSAGKRRKEGQSRDDGNLDLKLENNARESAKKGRKKMGNKGRLKLQKK